MSSKQIIGLGIWAVGIVLFMGSGLLDTENVLREDGRPDNTKLLWSFIAFVACIFAGYIFYDSGSSKLTHGEEH